MSYSPVTSPRENCTEDLLIEILLRLPVKSLVRFKAVSKTWQSLIRSPGFVESQLRHAITSNVGDDKTLVVNLYKEKKARTEDVSFALFHPRSGQLSADLKLPYPKQRYSVMPRSSVVGSDIGVVCVRVTYYALYDYNIYLWNPATKQSKCIPDHFVDKHESFGFGFDPIDSDFKVVKTGIYSKYGSEGNCSAVYSANKNTWRDIKPNPLDVFYGNGFCECLHGYLCGIGRYGMVAFDLNKEVFICNVKLPVSSCDAFRDHIINFKDSIAFLMYDENKGDKIALWTLDDEACLRGGGLEASWTLMTNIHHVAPPLQFVKGFSNLGDFKLDTTKFKSCYKNGSMNVQFCYDTLEEFMYTETLVSIAGSKQVDRMDCEL